MVTPVPATPLDRPAGQTVANVKDGFGARQAWFESSNMASGSALDLLRADHRQIEMWLDRLLMTVKHRCEGIVSEVRDVFAEIQQLMELHVRKEEMVVYPFLRTKFPEVLGEMDKQHHYIAEVTVGMDELTGMDGMGLTERQCEELIRLSKELFDVIQHHIVDEEDQLFRLADLHLSTLEQDCLVARMENLEAGPGPIETLTLDRSQKEDAMRCE